MINYFYTDANGQKQGPVDMQQLQTWAAQGVITPETPLESDTGHQGLAGQIPGLFATAPPAAPHVAPKQVFCTNCGNSVAEHVVACMSCGAKPTGHRKFCRQCGGGVGPEQVVCTKCGAGIAGVSGSDGSVGAPSNAKSKTLNLYFMIFWICMAVGYPLSAATIGIAVLIAGMIFAFMLLYQLWQLIPEDIARTTPGKAVGFCFIPFFNLYWVFVAYKGLGADMNQTLQQRGIPYTVNGGLGLTFCILTACSLSIFYLWPIILIGLVG